MEREREALHLEPTIDSKWCVVCEPSLSSVGV